MKKIRISKSGVASVVGGIIPGVPDGTGPFGGTPACPFVGSVSANPAWVLDHAIWEKAKKRAPGAPWGVVTNIYKKYGGRIGTQVGAEIKADQRFIVVLSPGPRSTLGDIMFETSFEGLARQFKGGLDASEIVSLFTLNEKTKARMLAERLLLGRSLDLTDFVELMQGPLLRDLFKLFAKVDRGEVRSSDVLIDAGVLFDNHGQGNLSTKAKMDLMAYARRRYDAKPSQVGAHADEIELMRGIEVEKEHYATIRNAYARGVEEHALHQLSPAGTAKLNEQVADKATIFTIRSIAQDHLNEIPDYYTRLATMEREAKVGSPSTHDTVTLTRIRPGLNWGVHHMYWYDSETANAFYLDKGVLLAAARNADGSFEWGNPYEPTELEDAKRTEIVKALRSKTQRF